MADSSGLEPPRAARGRACRGHRTLPGGSKGPRLLCVLLSCILVPLVAVVPGQAQTQPAQPSTPLGSLPPGTSPPTDLRVPAHLIPDLPSSSSTPPPDSVLDKAPVPAGYKAGVELVERRTETSKTFTGDRPGQLKTELYAGAKHYRDSKGSWVDIDAELSPSKDGKRQNKANSFALSVADSSTDGTLAQLGLDANHSVGFSLEGAAKVTAKGDKSSVTYFRTHKDTDVRLTSVRTGVKEELVLHSRAAPDRFVFPLQLKGLTAAINESGDIVYRDATGAERARTPVRLQRRPRISGEGPQFCAGPSNRCAA